MEPQFDDFDKGILSERQRKRYAINEPCQGDYIRRKDGLYSRITNIGMKNAQTLGYGNYEVNGFDDLINVKNYGSFSLGSSGHMSFSGSLNPGVPLSHLRDTRDFKEGSCWFFHHNDVKAHNGVYTMARVRVWELLDDSQAINKDIPARYIVAKEGFRGHAQTSTFTTFDGIERVSFNDNMTLDQYLKDKDDLIVVSSDEMDNLLKHFYNGMKTKPEEITKESYWNVYECFPPSRWKTRRGVNSWHCCERITGNLVSWFFEIGNKYYSFTDEANITDEKIESYISSIGG